MKHTIFKRINTKNGKPRLWLEGLRLLRAGFLPGAKFRLSVQKDTQQVVIQLTEQGDRKVSTHRMYPVLDIEAPLHGVFEGNEELQIELEAGRITVRLHPRTVRERRRVQELTRRLRTRTPLRSLGVFLGAGILDHAVHSGMHHEGVQTDMSMAFEFDGQYLEHALRNNPIFTARTRTIEGDAFDAFDVDVPEVDVLIAGIPCTGASSAGRASTKVHVPEAHPQGSCFQDFLLLVRRSNPALIVIENVPPYLNTAGYATIKQTLEKLGYTLTEHVLNSLNFGALERRERLVVIASSIGAIEVTEPAQPATQGTLCRVLENIPLDSPRWKNHGYLTAKQDRDLDAGKGFKMQFVNENSLFVPTLRRGYHKGGSTDPRVAHPENPGLSRLLTPREHAAVKGIPFDLVQGQSETMQHQMLGQSVVYTVFHRVGQLLARHLKAFVQQSTPLAATQ